MGLTFISVGFLSPIGGVPLPTDFIPSILFGILFSIALLVYIWRMSNSQTRNYVLIGTVVFTIER